jgi:hypothetical protein
MTLAKKLLIRVTHSSGVMTLVNLTLRGLPTLQAPTKFGSFDTLAANKLKTLTNLAE